MKKLLKLLPLVALIVLLTVALASCAKAPEPQPEAEAPTTEAGGVIPDIKQETLTPGKLTIATGEPAYSPWVIDDDPGSGEGLEPAVAYAVAEKLGFAKDEVIWVRTQFEDAIKPGPKDFDLNLQQYSINEERSKVVDFSSPYYVTSQAVVTNADNPYANAKSLAELKDAKIGVASGTTSLTIAQEKFGDNVSPFNDNDAAVQALKANQIDAVVFDVPTAFFVSGAELDKGKIIGIIDGSAGGDELAILLPKDSKLTTAVTAAVDALRADGTLDALAEQWLSTNAEVAILK
jgi:polar amino acid transport system substrate-binding protein